jgi:hypothetical protein
MGRIQGEERLPVRTLRRSLDEQHRVVGLPQHLRRRRAHHEIDDASSSMSADADEVGLDGVGALHHVMRGAPLDDVTDELRRADTALHREGSDLREVLLEAPLGVGERLGAKSARNAFGQNVQQRDLRLRRQRQVQRPLEGHLRASGEVGRNEDGREQLGHGSPGVCLSGPVSRQRKMGR